MSELVPQSLLIMWEKARDAFLSTGEIQTYEYELNVRKGISQFEARLTGCGEDEFVVVIREITKQKKMEQELISSENVTDVSSNHCLT